MLLKTTPLTLFLYVCVSGTERATCSPLLLFCIFKGEKCFKRLVHVCVIRLYVKPFHNQSGRRKRKRPWTIHDFVVSPTRKLFGTCFAFLNNPIDMQVSVQVGGSRLSFWFVFRKQHVRGDAKDREQSDSMIISPLFRYTRLCGTSAVFFFCSVPY